MIVSNHIMVSAVVSAVFFAVFHSWIGTGLCFLSGVLVDVDHQVDYFLVKKKITLNYKELWDFCADDRDCSKKFFLPLHSYELLLILWALIYIVPLYEIWIGMALGLTIHMFCDQFTNPVKPLFYFICYRWQKGFFCRNLVSKSYYREN